MREANTPSRPYIYLDNNATTPLDPHVAAVMCEALSRFWGNPSSVHSKGQEARAIVHEARCNIARSLKISTQQLVCTSGATEALNLAIRGICRQYPSGHIVSSTLEHPAVATTLDDLEHAFAITRVPAGELGAVDVADVRAALRPDTRLMVFMAANNETGVKNDLRALALLAAEKGIPLIIDGVALFGKEELPPLPGSTLWCFSAHKIHGPTGIGLLAMSPKMRLAPVITGGGQQYGRRGGTENILGILGFAEALRRLDVGFHEAILKIRTLRDHFESALQKQLPGVAINGLGERVCNTSNLSFEGVDGETLLYLLDQSGVAASMGSACSAGALEPSQVLLQMGYSRSRVLSSLRFSLSRMTTSDEIEYAIQAVVKAVTKLRS